MQITNTNLEFYRSNLNGGVLTFGDFDRPPRFKVREHEFDPPVEARHQLFHIQNIGQPMQSARRGRSAAG